MNNSLNLQEIDQEQAFNLTKFFIKSGKNICLFGQRGVGKTLISLQAAKECNYKVNYINLSVIDRSDISGFPNIHDTGDLITYKSPHFLPPLIGNNKPSNVILFDELDKCPPEVTAPLLELLQFKTINGKKIDVAACVLTGNLINERAHSNAISTALLDRTSKYILSFDFQQWVDWAKLNNIHDLIIGFLRNYPELACGKIDDYSYASPSPRGWTLASDAILKAKSLKIIDIETIAQIVSGFVGLDAGLKFKIWYECYRKFDPFVNSLIDSGFMNLNYNELLPTEKIVFVISSCYNAKQKSLLSATEKLKNKFIYLENLCLFMKKYEVDYEMQVMGLYNAFSFEQIAKNKFYESKMFFELFNKISEHITIKR